MQGRRSIGDLLACREPLIICCKIKCEMSCQLDDEAGQFFLWTKYLEDHCFSFRGGNEAPYFSKFNYFMQTKRR